jgi:parallel beta-helix repeat protein
MLILGALCTPLRAGDLEPPAAPASTPGPEPRIAINSENTPGDSTAFFRITSRGSHYLPQGIRNLSPTSTRHGIVIEADDVTIDLQGFTIHGYDPFVVPLEPQGIGPDTHGILAVGDLQNITIRNGIVRGWDNGIDITPASGCLVEGIQAEGNVSTGIRTGSNSVVTRCVARSNGGSGMIMGQRSTVSDCVATDNDFDGLFGNGATFVNCVADLNDRDGISGNRLLVSECLTELNGRHGVRVDNLSMVKDCVSDNNHSGAGFHLVGSSNRLMGNTATANSVGIESTTSGNLIIQNVVIGNDTPFTINFANAAGPFTGVGAIVAENPWLNFSL